MYSEETPDVPDKIVIKHGVPLMGAGTYGDDNVGFFCHCSVRLTHILEFVNNYKKLPVAIDGTEQFKLYKPADRKYEDITSDFFEENKDILINYHRQYQFHPHWQFGSYINFPFYEFAPFVRRFFAPSQQIKDLISQLELKYNIDYDNSCMAYYRGTDKYLETELISFDEMFAQIEDVRSMRPGINVVIQSDQTQFIELAREKYPGATIFENENVHTTTNNGIHYIYKDDENYKIISHFLAIMFIMSKCKYVITGSGNCGLWIALLRGNTDNYFQYLGKTFI